MIEGDDRTLFVETLAQATSRASGAALDEQLAQFGWSEALHDDPRTAVSVLFDLQGRAGATSGALDLVVASAAGWTAEDVGVVIPSIGRDGLPGRVEAGSLIVRGVVTEASRSGSSVLVATDDRAIHFVALDDLDVAIVAGVDPAMGLASVSGVVTSPRVAADLDWAAGVAGARLALAHELIGNSRTMLALAREHAMDRVQFDRPIAQFQAIRHKLADCFVAIESADAAAAAAWDEGSTWSADVAKAIAGRSARLVARHAQQILAGIGFTTEHDLHLHLRRTMLLDGLFGDARTLTRQVGARILRDGHLPPMLAL